ncbi:MAG: hypothetical protein HOQ28_20360 [Thermoleophilia bacterium]|nr:hypothetical protein [Thermoleophilia bacterium]
MRLGVLIVALALLAGVALADQHRTRAVSARASSDRWWCTHKALRCTGFDEAAHHERWELREHGYEIAGAALTGAILLVGGGRLRLRL